MGRGPREVGDLDLPSLAGMGGVILSVALLWGCSPDRRPPFAGWGLGRNSGWDCGQVLGTWYCPCDSFPGAGTQAGGSAPAPPHTEGGQAGGRGRHSGSAPRPSPADCRGGFFGPGCALRCDCGGGADCDPVSGQCRCVDGYTGPKCQQGESGSWGEWTGTLSPQPHPGPRPDPSPRAELTRPGALGFAWLPMGKCNLAALDLGAGLGMLPLPGSPPSAPGLGKHLPGGAGPGRWCQPCRLVLSA